MYKRQVLGAAFRLGGIAGGLFAGLAQGEGALELGSYLSDYLTLAAEGTVIRSFWPLLWEQMRYLSLIHIYVCDSRGSLLPGVPRPGGPGKLL